MQKKSIVTERIIRKNELCEMLGLSYSTIYRKIKSGGFPAPIRLGENSVGWRSSDIECWLNSRQEVVKEVSNGNA